MAYVIRRRQARHDGTRYYNSAGPVQRYSGDAPRFYDVTPAQEALARLREPRLWEILTEREADARDYAEQRAAARAPMNPLSAALLPLLADVAPRNRRG